MEIPNWIAFEEVGTLDLDDVQRLVEYAKMRERQCIIATEFISQARIGEEMDWGLAMDIIEAEEV